MVRPPPTRAIDQLLDGILSGDLAPGSHLPAERDLATQAGVNRQAVREALQRLRQMDLVEIVHGGGVKVQDWQSSAGLALLPILLVREGRGGDGVIDPGVARSIMELRATIGADAAKWCAERAPAGTAATLLEMVETMEAMENDPTQWGTIGFEFWEAVIVGADNVAYRLAFNTLRAVAAAVAPMLPEVLGAEWQLRAGYRGVAEAIAEGDGDAAETAARQLLGLGVAAVNHFLASREGTPFIPREQSAES